MAQSNFYTIDEVTANCVLVVPGATSENRNLFRQFVGLAMRDIGPSPENVTVCELFPKNNIIRKPDGMVATIDIALYDSSNTELKYIFHPATGSRIHINRFDTLRTFTNDSSTTSTVRTYIDLSEDTYSFVLGEGGSAVDHVLLRYFSMPVDDDGLPLIKEEYVMAMMAFCRYMWAMNKGDNQSEIQLAKMTWYEERDRAKGRAKMPDMLSGKAIMKAWMSMINAPKWDIS